MRQQIDDLKLLHPAYAEDLYKFVCTCYASLMVMEDHLTPEERTVLSFVHPARLVDHQQCVLALQRLEGKTSIPPPQHFQYSHFLTAYAENFTARELLHSIPPKLGSIFYEHPDTPVKPKVVLVLLQRLCLSMGLGSIQISTSRKPTTGRAAEAQIWAGLHGMYAMAVARRLADTPHLLDRLYTSALRHRHDMLRTRDSHTVASYNQRSTVWCRFAYRTAEVRRDDTTRDIEAVRQATEAAVRIQCGYRSQRLRTLGR